MEINSDRANIAGLTNQDIAASSGAGISGFQVGGMRVGEDQIPIVARMTLEDRARLSDLSNLYVYSTAVAQDLADFAENLPLSYQLLVDGAQIKQETGFTQLAATLLISLVLIYLALVLQLNSLIKPFLIFAAVPYGLVGMIFGLWMMGSSFGFIALLGMIALMGAIVSHVIVLFDFIEERHEEGYDLKTSLLDAGILRLRPVFITVGATTVLALVPLAIKGVPLWQPLCYAQTGSLIVAMGVTLILVPVFYAFFVMNLKIVAWSAKEPAAVPV